MTPKKVLFIHHGHARGGAFLSLLYLLRALDRTQYELILCNGGDEQDPQVEEVFSAEGITTCSCRLPRFAHTTLGSYNLMKPSGWRQLIDWIREYRSASLRLEKLLCDLQPDLVHFNSLTLAPYARVPAGRGIPNVVHVREPVLQGVFGIRRTWLMRHLRRYASRVIAICQDNLERLHLPDGKGIVIYNPVEFRKFDYRIERGVARKTLGIADGAPVALFAGGSVWDAKGLSEFLEAMCLVRTKIPNLVCLMPGFPLPPDPTERVWTFKRRIAWLLGMFRKGDRLFRLYKSGDLDTAIIRGGFVYDIENWIAACDVVCVPHMQPHFSRTVIEAAAMKKPVAGFAVGGVTEVVQDGGTGLLVGCGNVTGLADSVYRLLTDAELAGRLAEGGYRQAVEKFDAAYSARQVSSIYNEFFCHGL